MGKCYRTCIVKLRLVTAVIDKGGIGVAGFTAFQQMGGMLQWYGGAYHQGNRDIVNTRNQAGVGKDKGWANRTWWKSCKIFKSNYEPFNSGVNVHTRKSMMEHFMCTRTHNSPQYVKYNERIGTIQDKEFRGDVARKALFESQAELRGFNHKGGCPKSMRWASWRDECKAQLTELWSVRMVLEDHHGTNDTEEQIVGDVRPHLPPDRDEAAELRAMVRAQGSFRLVQTLITERLIDDCKVLYTCEEATWTRHSQRIKDVKNSDDLMRHNMEMAAGGWCGEIGEIIENCFRDPAKLRYIGLDPHPGADLAKQEAKCQRHSSYALVLSGYRI